MNTLIIQSSRGNNSVDGLHSVLLAHASGYEGKARKRATSKLAHLASIRRRRGTLLAIVLVALIVVSLTVAASIQSIVTHHRQIQAAEQQLQTEWLMHAARDRALHALASNASYTGETWNISPEALSSDTAKEIRIRVTSDAAKPGQSTLEIRVFETQDQKQRPLVEVTKSIKLPSSGGSS